MAGRVVTDLAIIPDSPLRCPICDNSLSLDYSIYRYMINQTEMIARTPLYSCVSCNEIYGTESLLNQLRQKIESKLAQSPTIRFPSHKVKSHLPHRLDKAAYDLSSYTFYVEKIVQNGGRTSLKDTKSMHNQETKKPQKTDSRKNTEPSKVKFVETFAEVLQNNNAPKSTLLVVQFEDRETHKEPFLFVVNDKEDHDGSRLQYFISSNVGNRVVEAIITKRDSFTLNTESFKILSVYKCPNFENRMKSRARIARVISQPTELVDVYVYNLKGLCRRHGDKTERLVVNMISSRSQNSHPLEVYYCPVCEKFYVNYETYFNFYKRYGMPPLRLHGDSGAGSSGDSYAALKAKSDLNLFGYNVSGELAEDIDLRWAILEDIIDSGNLTKAQVISHLEWLIRFGKRNEKMKQAITRWHSDLVHIEQYQPRYTNIWGQFKPGTNSIFL